MEAERTHRRSTTKEIMLPKIPTMSSTAANMSNDLVMSLNELCDVLLLLPLLLDKLLLCMLVRFRLSELCCLNFLEINVGLFYTQCSNRWIGEKIKRVTVAYIRVRLFLRASLFLFQRSISSVQCTFCVYYIMRTLLIYSFIRAHCFIILNC